MVIYGFAAVCRMARPAPSVNRPPRKRPYVRVIAAGMKRKAPTAMTQKPIIIPRLKPVRFSRCAAGIENRRYEI